jgi:dihydropteroate synthase
VTGTPPAITRPGRCVVMGILNVTPDSFSDGSRHDTVDAGVAHGLDMAAAGADNVGVGGESTRPGAERVDPGEERRRVLPVVAELARCGVTVSIDGLLRPPARRDATLATSVLAARAGAWGVRVQDVAGSADAMRVAAALAQNAPDRDVGPHPDPGRTRPAHGHTERWRSA